MHHTAADPGEKICPSLLSRKPCHPVPSAIYSHPCLQSFSRTCPAAGSYRHSAGFRLLRQHSMCARPLLLSYLTSPGAKCAKRTEQLRNTHLQAANNPRLASQKKREEPGFTQTYILLMNCHRSLSNLLCLFQWKPLSRYTRGT